ncbi:Veg protein [Ligilactobacillus pabuli]|uniref:Veg protein n=1 Tax=Ligilactobacillus pabuli TaxID=2886039 RepID=A0ABQ5JJ96_9LACO|nr:Veg family protein [Ligilactobacillus pabuli]GKS82115.1 Veg protein [Ligilactobacillus pabuli]HIW88944.1 Veg family protein [Candidatus Ligilactobacillus excrementipullorum]
MAVTLTAIKTKLDDRIGNNLTVTTQVGRKKVTSRHGILRETFPAVFVVDLDQDENAVKRVSYSYTDVLTRNIELAFDNE